MKNFKNTRLRYTPLLLVATLLFTFVNSSISFAAQTDLSSKKESALSKLKASQERLNAVSSELNNIQKLLDQKKNKTNNLTQEQKQLEERYLSLKDMQDDLNLEILSLDDVIQQMYVKMYSEKISSDNLGNYQETFSDNNERDLSDEAKMLYTSSSQSSNINKLEEIKKLVSELNSQSLDILGKKNTVESSIKAAQKEESIAKNTFHGAYSQYSDAMSETAMASKNVDLINKEINDMAVQSKKVSQMINSKASSSVSTPQKVAAPAPTPTTVKPKTTSTTARTTSTTRPSVTTTTTTTTPPKTSTTTSTSIKMSRPSAAYISSVFGSRMHPILKRMINHNGVDFAGSFGSNIRAAAKGKVIYAGEISGYGNVVIIDHGSGITTLYAHMSKILVSNGTSVSNQQVVGLVGSSGYATGPHLHFEVRKNGTPVDPMNYF